jgi:four helix bundle protein
MKPTFRFERLEVWQAARRLTRSVYGMARTLPKSEDYALGSQLRRAAISVSANIAEGSGRNSDADFAHFLEIAYGSAMECASLIFLGLDEKYFSQAEVDAALSEIDVVAAKLVALNRSLSVPTSKTPFRRTVGPAPRLSTLDPRL